MNDFFKIDAKIEILQALRDCVRYILFVGKREEGRVALSYWTRGQLPSLTTEEKEELFALHGRTMPNPPLRAPHHTVSTAGLLGGGYPEGPGEVSLASYGVLLLDDVSKFHGLKTTVTAIRKGQSSLRKRKGAEERTRYTAAPRIVIGTTDNSLLEEARNSLPWDREINL